MKRLRVGVVGVGHLGQHHARILASLPDVELVAVADSRPEQAQTMADRYGTRAVGDYRQLLGQVDAVSIAVPTVLHREVAGTFLSRGIAALVEKPLASSLAEAELLVSLSHSTGALLQVGHIERFNPALSALQQMAIRPKYISAERLSTYTFRSTDIGVVLDLMIHDIDLMLSMISSPVRSVAAVGVSLFGEHEDVANARIEFEDGTVANLTASRASYAAVRKMRIWGTEGYASLDFAAQQATLIQPSEEFLERPARHGRSRPQPALGREGASLRQGPPRGPGPDRRPRASGPRARRLRQGRFAAGLDPGSAVMTPCGPCVWRIRCSRASTPTAGTASPRRPRFPLSPRSRAPFSAAPTPGGSGARARVPGRRGARRATLVILAAF